MIVRRAVVEGELVDDADAWPFTVPAVKALMTDGLSFDAPVTFLVGENGSGKSTIVEALAEAYGADVRGGHIGRQYSNAPEKGALGAALRLDFAAGTKMQRNPRGFFLRAETAYGVFEFMSDQQVAGYGERHLLDVSHGESFLQVYAGRFNEAGVYFLDEPEAALSFSSCLALVAILAEIASIGGQVICATHSPLLSATPGANILELSEAGIADVAWDDLEIVGHWRRYLADPSQYLRHLLE